MMETMEAIQLRRSIRKYTAEPILDTELQTILHAGLCAPSGLNLQPWYFVVLKSETQRQALFSIMEQVCHKITPELETRFPTRPELVAETKQFIRTLGNAPVILLAFLMRDDYADPQTALISVAAAIENAVIAARALGIGSCWLTAAEQTGYGPSIRDHFAPGKGELVAMVTFGRTDIWPKMVARRDQRAVIL